MVHAIRIHEHGGIDKLRWEPVEVGAPGQGQIRVKHRAVGFNYIDTYFRSGLYKVPALPAVLGTEGSGDVVAVGPDTPVPEIARILNSHRIGGVPVVDETRHPVGMVSPNDLVRRAGPSAAENGTWWLLLFGEREDVARNYIRAHKLRAADVMSRGVVSIGEDAGIGDMARLMEEKRVNCLPVMRAGRMVGIVTRGDLMRAVASGGIATSDAGRPDLRQRILAELAAHRLAPPTPSRPARSRRA